MQQSLYTEPMSNNKTITVQREETITVLRTVVLTVPSDFDINSEDFDTLVSEHITNCDDSDVIDDQSASLDVIDVGPWELGMW